MAAVPPFGDMFKASQRLHRDGRFPTVKQMHVRCRRELLDDSFSLFHEATLPVLGGAPEGVKLGLAAPFTYQSVTGSVTAALGPRESGLGLDLEAKAKMPGGPELTAAATRLADGASTASVGVRHAGLVDGLVLTGSGKTGGNGDVSLDYRSPLGFRICPVVTVAGGAVKAVTTAATTAAPLLNGTVVAGAKGALSRGGSLANMPVQVLWRSGTGSAMFGADADLLKMEQPLSCHAYLQPAAGVRLGAKAEFKKPPPPAQPPAETDDKVEPAGRTTTVQAGLQVDSELVASALGCDSAVLSARAVGGQGVDPQTEVGIEAQWPSNVSGCVALRTPLALGLRATTVHAGVSVTD